MNSDEIDYIATRPHECPNVRKGVLFLKAFKDAVNEQSDGWHSWPVPSRAAQKLQDLLKTAGNLQYGTHGTITADALKKALVPIRTMVTKANGGAYGGCFKFDVDAVLNPPAKSATPTVAVKVVESQDGVPTKIVVFKDGAEAFRITRTATTDNDVSRESPRERGLTWGEYRDIAALFGIVS